MEKQTLLKNISEIINIGSKFKDYNFRNYIIRRANEVVNYIEFNLKIIYIEIGILISFRTK